MNNANRSIRQKFHSIQANAEAFPGVPILEIAGDTRVLIENHLGILEYGYENIIIKVNYGKISVSGNNLTMAQMTGQQLVILGKIQSVSIIRGAT